MLNNCNVFLMFLLEIMFILFFIWVIDSLFFLIGSMIFFVGVISIGKDCCLYN